MSWTTRSSLFNLQRTSLSSELRRFTYRMILPHLLPVNEQQIHIFSLLLHRLDNHAMKWGDGGCESSLQYYLYCINPMLFKLCEVYLCWPPNISKNNESFMIYATRFCKWILVALFSLFFLFCLFFLSCIFLSGRKGNGAKRQLRPWSEANSKEIGRDNWGEEKWICSIQC